MVRPIDAHDQIENVAPEQRLCAERENTCEQACHPDA
jgi:hypothetical protein